MDDADAPSRLLVVANRLPIVMKKNKGVWEFSMSSGGLVAALSALKTSYIWIGWPGTEVPAEDQEIVRQKLWDEYKCVPVFLEHKLAEVRPLVQARANATQAHYNGFSNGILWPLFHYIEDFQFSEDLWHQYQEANNRFAQVVQGIAHKNDHIWVRSHRIPMFASLIPSACRCTTTT